MTSQTKLVSIILPTYNGEKHIKDSIESCLRQTYRNIELIIVNDCSTDGTLELIKKYAETDSRIRLVDNALNLKLPASLNEGFKVSRGELLTWTSDDNMFRENAIERMVNVLSENFADFIYCGYSVGDMNGNIECVRPPADPNGMLFMNVVGACFLYTNKVYKSIGEYNVNLFCAEDYEYWSRIYRAGFKIVTCNEDLYIYRRHQNSLTSTKSRLICLNTEKVIAENIRFKGLSPKESAQIYLSYFKKSALRTGYVFSTRFFAKYVYFLFVSFLKEGAK